MKDMRNGETARALGGSDKLMRDQELQHLVSASIPSPPFSGLSLINTSSGLTVLDPIYSAHLLATIAASNPGTRFQLPIPIPLTLPSSTPRIHYEYTTAIPVTTTIPHNAQLDILSTWVNEQTVKEERDRLSKTNGFNNNNNNNKNNNNNQTGNNKKRGTNLSESKKNKKNKSQNGTEKTMKKEVLDDENTTTTTIDLNIIKPTILPIDKPGKVGRKKCNSGGDNNNQQQTVNNNIKGNTIQQSNQPQSRDKVFTCPICSRCFGYKHVLQNHERTHTGEKPYFCKICNKRFTRDHHLKTHMRLHTGEKPYNCTHCDKQFVQVANLRRHLRVHTGERPYSCELCSSRFSDSNQLKAHMLIHKGQKPYYCEACTGRFRRRHHLTHHKCMKVQDNNKPFLHSPPDISPPSANKRERKSRETRRIIRVAGLPVAATVTSGLDSYMPVVPEQTHPEDLSLSHGNGLRNRHFSGSHSSSVSGSSPSPSGGSHGSLGPYCNSVSSSETPEFYSDEERSGTADSTNTSNGKNDSDEHPSPSQG